MIVQIKMTKEEKRIAKDYAKKHGVSLKTALKDTYFEKIEDEYDAALADLALREYKRNSHTYTLGEVEKELGL